MLTRRTLVSAVPGIVAAGALAACSSLTPSTLQSDAQLIASGLGPIMADLQAAGVSVPADVAQKITDELAIISSEAAQIGSLVSGQNAAQIIVTAVGVIAPLVTPFFPAAPMVAAAVQAAVVLANTLVGSFKAAPAAVAPGQMTPAQARMILSASAKQ